MATYYAWTDIRNGGEVDTRKAPGGREIKVVTKRNVVERGEKVTKGSLKVSDEEWEGLLAGGSVRPYPLPEGSNENISPTTAILRGLVDNRGEIDLNKLMELGLTVPPPGQDEESEVPVGA